MMIERIASPNFNTRKDPVNMLVLHYTGMESGEAALNRMCDRQAMVSAHYMVREDGHIVQLVDEEKRAWHAGISSWQGKTDLNTCSIGIEIVNGGHDFRLADGTLPAYPHQQIDAVCRLCHAIIKRWNIPCHNIVGHSDIAPTRKRDPGEHFPWAKLAVAGIGFWPETVATDHTKSAQALKPGDQGTRVKALQGNLAAIGYGLDTNGTYNQMTQSCVTAFQRRWVQNRINGIADLQTQGLVKAVRKAYDQF